ncbi:MAG: hypothetical protein EAZ68_23035, partial [Oscillatoriales cyanobacterium]
ARDGETLEGIYAFYHPTFQEYFAALAVEDWHFFLNHISKNPQHPDARYRIFEKQWKEVIVLWLGREEVGKEEKEGFIKALVKFKVGCSDFYGYRAYFLAAAGIAEFKDCSFADEIVSQVIKWGFGYFNEEKHEWQTFPAPLAKGSREILKETDRERAIVALVELTRNSGDVSTRRQAAESLEEIGKNNPVGIAALVELIRNSGDEDSRWRPAESLEEIGKNNPVASVALVELIRNSGDENTRWRAAYILGEIGKDNPVAIAALVELIRNSDDEDTRRQAVYSLGKISKDNPVAISALVELINTSQDEFTRSKAADSLGKIDKDNPVAIAALVELIRNSGDVLTRRLAAESLRAIMKGKHFTTAVSGLKHCLTSEIYENDYERYQNCYQIIWDCAQNMTYPDFYQAWHTQPTNSPTPNNHRQNTDIPTLLKQLQPTHKTCPVPLNIRALEGETDTSAIAQELCTQLYQTIFPADTDIPAIRNAPEFKRLIPQLKNRLQKQHIALILHSCPCEDALSSFTRKLADTQMGIHIAWITDTPLELPLTGFAVDADDLLNALHNWMEGIG